MTFAAKTQKEVTPSLQKFIIFDTNFDEDNNIEPFNFKNHVVTVRSCLIWRLIIVDLKNYTCIGSPQVSSRNEVLLPSLPTCVVFIRDC